MSTSSRRVASKRSPPDLKPKRKKLQRRSLAEGPKCGDVLTYYRDWGRLEHILGITNNCEKKAEVYSSLKNKLFSTYFFCNECLNTLAQKNKTLSDLIGSKVRPIDEWIIQETERILTDEPS